ncbi:Brap, partial [Symbiodinium microadriaticum]
EGTGRLDLLSPPPPPRLRLPSCPVCLRRIKSCVSGVSGAEELIVGPAFSGNGDRCPVCFVSSDEGEAKRVCGVCGLHENLWTCLQCGYVGCGRYTAQHAKKHFHNKGHPFSLELVSQRIWDYVNDTFVHIDPYAVFSQTLADMDASREHSDRTPLVLQSSARNPTSLPSALLLQQSQQEPFPVGGVLDDNGAENTRTRATWMVEKPVDMIDTHREYIMQHLDSAVVDKLSYLQTDYERLLEQQLLDQRLHYEKLIARETVRLLEVGIRVRNGSISSVGAPSHDRKGDCLGGGGEEASGENADRVAADLEIIENLKLEISALEYDYAETLQKIR